MQIVVLDGYTLNPGDISWQSLEALGTLTVYPRTRADEIAARIQDADVIITNKTPITATTLATAPRVQYIGVLATGYDVVDVAAAAARGIPVTNIPAYGTQAVAQYAIALLLELCHHIGAHAQLVHDGVWATKPDWCFWEYPQIELAHKTMGIIGYGRIGHQTSGIAQALGMNVLTYSPNQSTEADTATCHAVALATLFEKADVIVLHCPSTPATRGMINHETIAQMKPHVLLVNDARGDLIDAQDLADALAAGRIAGAALDVTDQEPLPADHPLLTAPNLLITPHIAWAAIECRQRIMTTAAANLAAWQNGQPQNTVATH